MELKQTFSAPISGYWDGGAKSTFYWKIGNRSGQDARGRYVEVGSWGANHWFMVAEGRTERQTLGNARRRLAAAARKHGQVCTFEYVENGK